MSDEKNKKFFRIQLEESVVDEFEKAREWFGLSSDVEAMNLAVRLLLRCYEAEQAGEKFCIWNPEAKEGRLLEVHKEKEEEPEIEVDLEDEKSKGMKN